ncbi:MAG: HAD-IA family hydrolase [Nanoarchaeota archaeon]
MEQNNILVFDLSGVFFNDGLEKAISYISNKYKLEPKNVEYVLNGSFAEEYRTGLIKVEDFWDSAKEYLKVENIEDIKKIFFGSYYPQKQSLELIKKLRDINVKVAYLSDSPKDRVEYLNNKYNFISLFDFGIFSYEAHSRKPDINIYKKFTERFKLDPKKVIYIDDREKNLIPAKQLGMKTILYKSITQLQEELKNLGYEI